MTKEAALPFVGYAPPKNRFRAPGTDVVRVYPEGERGYKDFSFHTLAIGPDLQALFAQGFAAATGPSGSRRTIASAKNLYAGISVFVRLVNASTRPPKTVSDLRPAHLAQLRMRHTSSANSALTALRVVLRTSSEIPVAFRERLFTPVPSVKNATAPASYSEAEFRGIRRAARKELRAALVRIRAGEAELAKWRRDDEQKWTITSAEEKYRSRGSILNYVAMHGEVPDCVNVIGAH